MSEKMPTLDADWIIGLVTSLLSFALFIFILYIFPALVFGLKYSIPGFLIHFREYLVLQLNVGDTGAAALILLLFIMMILALGFVAYRYTYQIEQKEIFAATGELPPDLTSPKEMEHVETEVDKVVPETPHFGVEVVLLAIAVVLGVFILHWMISI